MRHSPGGTRLLTVAVVHQLVEQTVLKLVHQGEIASTLLVDKLGVHGRSDHALQVIDLLEDRREQLDHFRHLFGLSSRIIRYAARQATGKQTYVVLAQLSCHNGKALATR